MNYLTRIACQFKIEFHTQRIRQYRSKGARLLQKEGALCSPQLLRLSQCIDHHGRILHQLEEHMIHAA